ncbi:MAG: HRDC domain-containing protein [Xanthomonadaceae bacterium]|nr:HRDC domain-containing protein [Xanthomonadaceae bacterium]
MTDNSNADPVRTIHYLRDEDHIRTHSRTLRECKSLGLDTEFVRERTFLPYPGLIQISDGQQVWLVDPIALGGQGSFQELMSSLLGQPDQEKILHSASEDLELFELLCQTLPDPLFDTQIAAALLGWPLQVRYETLANELLGLEFAGGLARNDWRRRPLPEAWLEYASNDVIALPAMRELLAARLEEKGRLEWLREDCAGMLQRFHDKPDPRNRIRGAAGLDDESLARLALLAEWRDSQAMARNLPRGFIVADPPLLEIARRNPTSQGQLRGIADVGSGFVRRYADELITLLESSSGDSPRPPELTAIEPQQRSKIKHLQGLVRTAADALGIEPAVIASKRELTRLVQGAENRLEHGWRKRMLGTEFFAAADSEA